jgi:hemoglobin
MRDIETKKDIEFLMENFYSKLLMIPHMHKVFENIDMAKHMPHIVHFWSFVLLDEEGYKTNVFEKHLSLPIKTPQFDVWLEVFIKNVIDNFKGEKADLAVQRATALAFTFKSKWEKIKGS